MLNTFIVGGGRAGLGLHWPVLRKLRARPDETGLWSPDPPVVWDVQDIREQALTEGLVPAESLAHAAKLADPATTVVHLCTPPADRFSTLQELADLGYTRIVVEKPMAVDLAGLEAIDMLARVRGLRLRVVSPWLASSLTRELAELTRYGTLGELRSMAFTQFKPRWTRTLRSNNHTTAFDVELPHSLGVALRIAGDARITDAALTDMRIGDTVIPDMGGARLTLQHHNGVTTEIASDLTSPIRERRVGLRFDTGDVVGHYPISDVDHHASLTVHDDTGGGAATPRILFDDALTSYVDHAYREYRAVDAKAGGVDGGGPAGPDGSSGPGGADGLEDMDDYAIARRVVQLLQEARLLAAAQDARQDAATPVRPPLTGVSPALRGGADHEG
ncbi:Gfo/Idh/MocA family oxidoreductase [Streptomyces sp. NBC_00838]|uniref:Gfo/Idh/MocA family oxidoreductase n=1 Tax=Streptomyces sp. NBC_00838 TaxID=2903680 RepID=UPI00386B08F9|nr:Gfo/Idh/MocA family oxidoreductase [Streptomyces sp. NBC_00838]